MRLILVTHGLLVPHKLHRPPMLLRGNSRALPRARPIPLRSESRLILILETEIMHPQFDLGRRKGDAVTPQDYVLATKSTFR